MVLEVLQLIGSIAAKANIASTSSPKDRSGAPSASASTGFRVAGQYA